VAEFDHIVIGGGASGCTAAADLVRAGRKVLLLEAGYSNRHPLIDMPPGIFKLISGSKYMTYHTTPPQPQLDGRQHDIPQGHVLGGGSSVNAQVYMRGRPSDYEAWDRLMAGNSVSARWNWDTMLALFRDMEGNDRLNDGYHGTSGPLLVSDPGHIDQVSRWFIQSVQEIGVPFTHDFNGPHQPGVGFYQFMNRAGQRCSAADAMIDPIKGDPRLTIRLRARVERLLVENGVCIGVEYRDRAGRGHRAEASGDVILAAGALITPKLLMLSGLGPADQLRRHDIKVLADLPGVGSRLVDHPEVPLIAQTVGPWGYFGQGEGFRMLKHLLNFKLFGTGPINSVGFEAGAFFNPADPSADPTVQAFCIPIMYLDRDLRNSMRESHGVTITTVLCRPKARGSVTLRSADPAAPPIVSPNLLGDPDDMARMTEGQLFFREALRSGPLGERVARILAPAEDAIDPASIARHCRRFVKTDYHPCATAPMGPDDDAMAVLDATMAVRGVSGLRVGDMSAPPDLIAGNTNALAMVLGRRCAAFVLGTDRAAENTSASKGARP
jgi:choline dehydrogenase